MLEKIKRLLPRRFFKALQPPYHYLVAWLAAVAYRFPSRKLIVIGVTGTAGKTSTVYLIAKMLSEAGYKTGFTSTAQFSDGDREWLNDKKMTMPGRFFIQKSIRRMLANSCRYAVIETTSEGVKQFRHRFIDYDALVFTGLYPEHIESHGSFEKYKEAKGKLFAHLRHCRPKYINESRTVIDPVSRLKKLDLKRVVKTAIVNGDDENADYFLSFWSEAKIACTFDASKTAADFLDRLPAEARVKDFSVIHGGAVASDASGTSFEAEGQAVKLALLGSFNAANALLAFAVGRNQDISPETVSAGLASVSGLAGKLEKIDAGQDFTAIVDYSFEPKAMEKLYQTVAAIPHTRIIQVLGSAGGGRDKARRPLLGEIAGKKADIVIVTDEDPYDEDPALIMDQVAAGAENAGKIPEKDLFLVLDRRQAIKKAVSLAETGDLLLFTGKGAEQYICIKDGGRIPWDERRIVREEIVEKLCIDKD